MRRTEQLLAIGVVAALALTVAGCGGGGNDPADALEASPVAPAEPGEDEAGEPDVPVEVTEPEADDDGGEAHAAALPEYELVTRYEEADEAHPAYVVDVTLPRFTGVSEATAERIHAQLDGWAEERLATYASEDAEFGAPSVDLPPGAFEVVTNVGALNPSLVSVVLTETSMHRGAAHPWTTIDVLTFDTATGERVGLTDLFAEDDPVLEVVSAQVIPALIAQLDPGGEGWAEEGVREGAAPDAELLHRAAIDEDGLTVHFDQYQVAPGAAGTLQVTISWDTLLSDLDPSPRLAAALAYLRSV